MCSSDLKTPTSLERSVTGTSVAAQLTEQRDNVFLEIRGFRGSGSHESLGDRRADRLHRFVGLQGQGCCGQQAGEQHQSSVKPHTAPQSQTENLEWHGGSVNLC